MKHKLFLVVILTLLSIHMRAQFAGGDGTEQSPYLIEDALQLDEVRNHFSGSIYFKLTKDIDLTDWIANNQDEDIKKNGWKPIDTNEHLSQDIFNFDGGGHTIKGLVINRPYSDNLGLFGKTSCISVKNLHIEECHITGRESIGGLIGGIINPYRCEPFIENCSVTGTIYTLGNAGLLIGNTSSSKISKCYTSGIIKERLTDEDDGRTLYAGGLIGHSSTINITDCRTDCIILLGMKMSGRFAGGIAGRLGGTVKNCYTTGYLSGGDVGGIVGESFKASITNCVAAQHTIEGRGEAGRITGNHSEVSLSENYALNNMRINGEIISGNSGGIHGGSKTTTQLNSKATYDALGWDVASVWKIENGASSPYLTPHSVPATITTDLKSKVTTIDGTGSKSTSYEVWIKLNNQKYQKATLNNGKWTITLPKLSTTDIITVISSDKDKRNSQSIFYVDYLGDGTESSPFLISTPSDLNAIRYKGYYAHYMLENDIDFKSWIDNNEDSFIQKHGWYSIGTYGYARPDSHKGAFIDGKGFKIKNLTSKNVYNHASLFTVLSDAAKLNIKNLTIEDCYLVSENGSAAPFMAGDTYKLDASIENCRVSGYISGKTAAGLITESRKLTVKDCIISANIKGIKNAGGITYRTSDGAEIDNVHVYGSIKSKGNAAGLILHFEANESANSEIKNSSVSSFIEGENMAAGFIPMLGSYTSYVIEDCYSSSIVKGQKVYGLTDGEITYNDTDGKGIKNCYVQGIISAEEAYGVVYNSWKCQNLVSALSAIKGLGGEAFRFTRSIYGESSNNFALETMLVNNTTIKGGNDSENKHGKDASLSQLKSSNFYTSTLGWNFAKTWKIDNGISFPYFKQQTAPPTLTTAPVAGATILKGTCASGVNQIVININDKAPITVTPQGTSWSYTLKKPLQIGDAVLVYAQNPTLYPSYALTYSLDNKKGLGTVEDPILVSNAEELNAIRSNTNAVHKLTNDIDLGQWIDNNTDQDIREKGWLPIGYLDDKNTVHMNGRLIGEGHKIRGLRINRPETDYVGLFGSVDTVEHVILDDVSIIGRNYVGAIAGTVVRKVASCYVQGRIEGQDMVGGILGGVVKHAYLEIIDCSFTGSIKGNNNIGGIVGYINKPMEGMGGANRSNIQRSRTSLVIEGNEYVGGILGRGILYEAGWIEGSASSIFLNDCYSTGVVKGNKNIGGINGNLRGEGQYNSDLASSYSSAIVIGKSDIGGLTGAANKVSNSVAVNKTLIGYSLSSIARVSPYEYGNLNDNYAYKDMLVNYEMVVSSSANHVNGQSKSMNDLLKKTTYIDLGWSDEIWDIKENISLPYHVNQVEAPVLSTTIASEINTLNGTFDSTKGSSVMIQINADTPIAAKISGNTWTASLNKKLEVSDVLLIWTEGKGGKQRSYAVCEMVTLKGLGTEDNPYLIHNAAELNSVRTNLRANYRLENDIDLTDWIISNKDEDIKSNGWMPIGDKDNSFTGSFVGRNHTIKGLKINRPKQLYVGLFGHISSHKIDSINIADAEVIGADATGILAGGMYRNVTNVNASGKVSGLTCVGGLVGIIDSGDANPVRIRWNSFKGDVSGYDYIGGLIGAANNEHWGVGGPYDITIQNNTTSGNIKGHDKVGGLIGSVENESKDKKREVIISQNYASTVIKGNDQLGGIVGYGKYYKSGTIQSSLEIKDSYATGFIEGNESIGGIIGYVDGYTSPAMVNISNCYAANYLKGNTRLGGISGYKGNIRSCFAMNPSIVCTDGYQGVGQISLWSDETTNNYYYENIKLINLTNPEFMIPVTDENEISLSKDKLMKKETYQTNGWNFVSVWNIWEGHSYPYFFTTEVVEEEPDKTQITPPEIISKVHEGVKELSGVYYTTKTKSGNVSDISVWVKINEEESIRAKTANGTWNCVLTQPLEQFDIIKVWSSAANLKDSYDVYNIVGDNDPHIAVDSISLNKKILTLNINQSELLIATILPNNVTNKVIKWTSSNDGIVTVDSEGKVTAMSAGTVTITVTSEDGNKQANCIVTVTVPVGNISLNKTKLSLIIGDTETITASITPENATNKNVSWISSDSVIAQVNALGKVTAKSPGIAIITATTQDGDKQASCEVKVQSKPIVFSSFTINDGDKVAVYTTVDLTYTLSGGKPSHFMVSEKQDFKDATWQVYNPAALTYTFTSDQSNAKTVYTKLKNDVGETEVRSDDIFYKPYHPVVISALSLNNGAAKTANKEITLNHTVELGEPISYSVSENELEIGSNWQPYNKLPAYSLTEGNGVKEVFFAVFDGIQMSNVVSSKIELLESTIMLYPNPVKDLLYIESYDSEGPTTVQIYSLNGRLLLSKKSSESKIEIDLSSCSSGTLLVKISNGNKTETHRVIKL